MPTLNSLAVVDPRIAMLPDPPLAVKIESVMFGGQVVPITESLRWDRIGPVEFPVYDGEFYRPLDD